jgi:hypothetical protein
MDGPRGLEPFSSRLRSGIERREKISQHYARNYVVWCLRRKYKYEPFGSLHAILSVMCSPQAIHGLKE